MTFGSPSELADYRVPRSLIVRDVEALIGANPEIFSRAIGIGFRSTPIATSLVEEWMAFVKILESRGIDVFRLKNSSGLSLDALYVRDPVAVAPKCFVKCRMHKDNRATEVPSVAAELETLGVVVKHVISAPGFLEAGDIIWLADDICAIGLSARTNICGANQFIELLGPDIRPILVPIPHVCGSTPIIHLSSLMSVISKGVVVADVNLLPANFTEELRNLGFRIIAVPESERSGLNANMLPIGDNELLAVAGNECTSAMLRSFGFFVTVVPANNLCILGEGGPTCLTRPLKFTNTSP
jgi:N-dimethylarginine dimethylaminohydrolase